MLLPVASNDATSQRNLLIALLTQAGSGDGVAFRAVYTLTYHKVMTICRGFCAGTTLAEEAAHDTYLAIWRNAARYDAALGNPISWMATIARNRSIDALRRQQFVALVPIDAAMGIPASDPTPEASALCADELRHLRKCLTSLSSFQREIIEEAFFEGKTYAELAKLRDVPLGTLKSWMRRTLLCLRTEMQRDADPILNKPETAPAIG